MIGPTPIVVARRHASPHRDRATVSMESSRYAH
jgi:hypothetical protein